MLSELGAWSGCPLGEGGAGSSLYEWTGGNTTKFVLKFCRQNEEIYQENISEIGSVSTVNLLFFDCECRLAPPMEPTSANFVLQCLKVCFPTNLFGRQDRG
jgi:hypothetical protein